MEQGFTSIWHFDDPILLAASENNVTNMTIARQRLAKNTYPWQRIDTVTDELFEMVIYIWFASKLQKESSVQSQVILHSLLVTVEEKTLVVQ
jgi:hypothetical protein